MNRKRRFEVVPLAKALEALVVDDIATGPNKLPRSKTEPSSGGVPASDDIRRRAGDIRGSHAVLAKRRTAANGKRIS